MTPIFLQATTTAAILLVFLLLSTPTTTTADIVLDCVGKPVMAGSYYYAVPGNPIITERLDGGLTMFNNGSVSCPTFIVAQSSSHMDYGIPIKFTPNIHIKEKVIYSSSRLSIAFKYLRPQPLCRRRYSTVWAVSGPKRGNLVMLDGIEGKDGSSFKLEYGFKFNDVSYYSIWHEGKIVLSEYKKNGGILLGLEKGNPLYLAFVKEDQGSSFTHEK